MTVYSIAFAAARATLEASSDTGGAMTLAPDSFKYLAPDQVITASGRRKLNGLPSVQLFWSVADPAIIDDIADRSGGTSESSIYGALRIQDWLPRAAGTTDSWSIFDCWIDQPVTGEFRVGSLRFGLMVPCRQLVVYKNLAP